MKKGFLMTSMNSRFLFPIYGWRQSAYLWPDAYWRNLFWLDNVSKKQRKKSMNETDILIEEIVLDIATLAGQLDELRLRMFVNWLIVHSGKAMAAGRVAGMDLAALRGMEMQERVKSTLQSLLASLSVQDMLLEYRTISSEIAWWRDLDSIRLKAFVNSEMEQCPEPTLHQSGVASDREKTFLLDK